MILLLFYPWRYKHSVIFVVPGCDREGTIMNTRLVQQRAWKLLAKEEDLWFPPIERKAIYDVMPERAITEVWSHAARCHSYAAHLLCL